MNDLEAYFTSNVGRQIDKWWHYFEIYEHHFSRFRGKAVNILEIGVFRGGSLQMWKSYFGSLANIYGVDINPQCKELEEDHISILIGDQEDRIFLQSLVNKIPAIDILIDDGGHFMNQQINTFEVLFPHLSDSGVYLCEDLHTSYWPKFGGGYRKSGSFVEYSKNFIDFINAWFITSGEGLSVSDFTRTVHSIHFYNSILVIEKRLMQKPFSLKSGIF